MITLGDLAMMGILSLAAIAAIGYATRRIDAAFEAGIFVLAFYLVLTWRGTARSLARLADILTGEGDAPVRQEFRALIERARQMIEEFSEQEREGKRGP